MTDIGIRKFLSFVRSLFFVFLFFFCSGVSFIIVSISIEFFSFVYIIIQQHSTRLRLFPFWYLLFFFENLTTERSVFCFICCVLGVKYSVVNEIWLPFKWVYSLNAPFLLRSLTHFYHLSTLLYSIDRFVFSTVWDLKPRFD